MDLVGIGAGKGRRRGIRSFRSKYTISSGSHTDAEKHDRIVDI